MQLSGGRCSWQGEKLVQRPLGRNGPDVFEDWQGGQCGWNRSKGASGWDEGDSNGTRAWGLRGPL